MPSKEASSCKRLFFVGRRKKGSTRNSDEGQGMHINISGWGQWRMRLLDTEWGVDKKRINQRQSDPLPMSRKE